MSSCAASNIRRIEMARLNAQLESLQQQADEQRRGGHFSLQDQSELDANSAALHKRFGALAQQLAHLQHESQRDTLVLRDAGRRSSDSAGAGGGRRYPNSLSIGQKIGHFLSQIWQFVSDSPTSGGSENGALPAIFGTVLMVLLMSVIVMPLGVVAAVWLHEYAGRNALTRLVRIAVVNLAGVPSIVYGVFGLGFLSG